jgi:hypothetical protein
MEVIYRPDLTRRKLYVRYCKSVKPVVRLGSVFSCTLCVSSGNNVMLSLALFCTSFIWLCGENDRPIVFTVRTSSVSRFCEQTRASVTHITVENGCVDAVPTDCGFIPATVCFRHFCGLLSKGLRNMTTVPNKKGLICKQVQHRTFNASAC